VARAIVNHLFDAGEMITRGMATTVLVESLLQRGSAGDLTDAQAAIDRLAAVPTDPGFVLFEIPLLRLRADGTCQWRRSRLPRVRGELSQAGK
jgi:adenylate cyclase